MKLTLASYAVLAALLATSTPTSARVVSDPLVAKRQWAQMIVDSMTLDGMDVGLTFLDCGQSNAFYYPEDHMVVVCNELLEAEDFGVVKFVVAHEMSHAIIMQKDLPYTGSHEDAADELAAVYMYVNDMPEEIFSAAEWFWQYSEYEGGLFDDHTWPKQRAGRLLCLFVGAVGDTGVCGARFERALRTWDRLLKL